MSEYGFGKYEQTPKFKHDRSKREDHNESNLMSDQFKSMTILPNFSLDGARTPDLRRHQTSEISSPMVDHLKSKKVSKKRKKSGNFIGTRQRDLKDLKEKNQVLTDMLKQYELKTANLEKQLDEERVKGGRKKSIFEQSSDMRKLSVHNNSDYLMTMKKFDSFKVSGVVDDKASYFSINSEQRKQVLIESPFKRKKSENRFERKQIDDKLNYIKRVFTELNGIKSATAKDTNSSFASLIKDYEQTISSLKMVAVRYKNLYQGLNQNFIQLNDQFLMLSERVKEKEQYALMDIKEDEDSQKLLDDIMSEDDDQMDDYKYAQVNRLVRNKTAGPNQPLKLNEYLIRSKVSGMKTHTPQERRKISAVIDSSLRKKTEEIQKVISGPSDNYEYSKDIYMSDSNFPSNNKLARNRVNTLSNEDPSYSISRASTVIDHMNVYEILERLQNKFKETQKRANVKIESLSSLVNDLFKKIRNFDENLKVGNLEFGNLELNRINKREDKENSDVVDGLNKRIDQLNMVLSNIEHTVIRESYRKTFACLKNFFQFTRHDIIFANKIQENIDSALTKIDDALSNNTSDILNIKSSFQFLFDKMNSYLERKIGKPSLSHKRTKSYSDMVKLKKENFDISKHMADKIKNYFENNYVRLKREESHSRLLNVSELSNKSTNFMKPLFQNLNLYIINTNGEYEGQVNHLLNSIDEFDRKIDNNKWKGLLLAQMTFHSAITQKLRIAILDSLYHCMREHDYKINNPNLKVVVKIFSKKLNEVKKSLLKGNFLDLKKYSNNQTAVEEKYESIKEIYGSKTDRGKNPSDYIFTAEICFIEMFIETWIPLFN